MKIIALCMLSISHHGDFFLKLAGKLFHICTVFAAKDFPPTVFLQKLGLLKLVLKKGKRKKTRRKEKRRTIKRRQILL